MILFSLPIGASTVCWIAVILLWVWSGFSIILDICSFKMCWNRIPPTQIKEIQLYALHSSPSAVPWTRRYSTEWKFLALAVTVEFCTDSDLCDSMANLIDLLVLDDNSNHRTHFIASGILRRLHHVTLSVDGIYYIKTQYFSVNLSMKLVWIVLVKSTIICPFGDWSHSHSTFENSTSRTQHHGRNVSPIGLFKRDKSSF